MGKLKPEDVLEFLCKSHHARRMDAEHEVFLLAHHAAAIVDSECLTVLAGLICTGTVVATAHQKRDAARGHGQWNGIVMLAHIRIVVEPIAPGHHACGPGFFGEVR